MVQLLQVNILCFILIAYYTHGVQHTGKPDLTGRLKECRNVRCSKDITLDRNAL